MIVQDDEVVPLLALMPPEVRALVEASLVRVRYAFGEPVVREGEEADALYLVTSGTARVVTTAHDGREVPLDILRGGDAFGESAVFDGGRRAATVRACGPLEVLRLDRAVLLALVRTEPAVREWVQQRRRLHELNGFLRLRTALSALPPDALVPLLSLVETVDLTAGAVVAVEPAVAPGRLFAVREGRLVVERDSQTVGVLRAGDLFSEQAALHRPSDGRYVRAVTAARLLILPGDAVQQLTAAHEPIRDLLTEQWVHDVRPLAHVPLDFADELVPEQSAAPRDAKASHGPDDSPAREESPAPEKASAPEQPPTPDGGASRDRRRGTWVRRRRPFPHMWQLDEMDCAAACLAMVCRYFGARVSLPRVREAVATDADGTSLHGIVLGAHRLGLSARPLKASKSNLDRLPLPAVCHVDGNHWVVLHRVGPRHVHIDDPATGARRLPRDEWEDRWTGYCALLARTPALDELPVRRSPWRWLLPFAAQHARVLLVAGVLALFAAALQMLIPVAAGLIVDAAVDDRDPARLHLLAAGMLVLLTAAVVATALQRSLLARMAVRFDSQTLDHLVAHLLDLPLHYFQTRRTGDIERRLAGMRQVRMFLLQEGTAALTAGAQVLVAVVLMLVHSPVLALAFAVTAPLQGAGMFWSRRWLRPLLASLEEAFGRYHARQVDAIKGIEAVKARGAEPSLRRVLRRQFDDLADRVYRADRAFLRYDAGVQATTFLTLAVFVWAGGLLVLAGRMSVGELVAFNGLVVLAGAPVAVLLRTWDELQYVEVLLGRIDDVLDREPEQGEDRAHLRPVPHLGGRVTLEQLSYVAPGPVPVPLLEDVSLDIPPGATVALVGRSGAGKTTLVKCLTGLLEPSRGRVLYDGVDLRELDWRELRRRVGAVLQDDYLLDDTIAANIALGDAVPDDDRVRWAAAVAAAAAFIDRLPLGYNTRVGETGIRLSGGQAQRLAIARAVYRRPAVLLLDEATSALDADAERAVKDGLNELRGRTAIVVAHRLSTVRDADLIVVLDRGRVVEQGTHGELVLRHGLYWHLVNQQLES